ncbi:hypothetical protein [Marixanthomonas spongiae]|uniref:DUF3575 domain-containing protein n=1 Tax=Marixanthomonas spongiae TaxID=2174845 RepID=A0A2U0I7I0_9FLAO|nr:hypothetical protein [Marixanthomonas spongiae]PVW17059.1 hypothetical protein DDV96_00590 [Marixanthomonas spongiae]
MKSINLKIGLFTAFFFTVVFTGIAQEETNETPPEKNEIKLNIGYVIAGLPEVTYERYLTDETAIGVSVAFSIEENIDYNFIAVPYFRFYFGKKNNAGFFVEGNAGLFSEEYIHYGDFHPDYGYNNASIESKFGLGLGMAVGGKFITKKGWIAELVGGLGRNFSNTEVLSEVYPRLGISIGKRF